MITLSDGRNELWQWDTNRKLNVDADCSQVHFSNKVYGRSIDVDVVNGTVFIPDILLQTDKDLYVWAFVGTPENGHTKISKIFKVNRRNKPADYVFTPVDQLTLEEIKEIAESVREDADNGLFKGDKGDAFTYEDFTEEQLAALKGDPGYTPVKGVDYFDGKDGVSVTHRWNGTTLTVTSASGTSSADLKGEKGDPFVYSDFTAAQLAALKGEKGDPGYTPIKGKDYVDGKDGYTPVKGVDYTDGLDGIGIVNITSSKPVVDLEGNRYSTLYIYTERPDGTDSKRYSFQVQHGRNGAKGEKGEKGDMPKFYRTTYTSDASVGEIVFIPIDSMTPNGADIVTGEMTVAEDGKLYMAINDGDNGHGYNPCRMVADLKGPRGWPGAVQTVNGVAPDTNGNVQIEVGSGSGIEVTAKPGQLIRVKETDENGKPTAWEAVPWGYTEGGMVEIPVQGEWMEVDDGSWAFMGTSIGMEIGKTYVVNWDGADYEVTAFDLAAVSGGQASGVCIGNGSASGLEDTGEPFMILDAGEALMAMGFDASANHTFTIFHNSETHHPIPGELLPDGVPYVEKLGETHILQDFTIASEEDSGSIPALGLVVGNTYAVRLNTEVYTCVAFEMLMEGVPAVGLGDIYTASGGYLGTEPTGEPFVLAEIPPDAVAQFGMHVMFSPISEDITLPLTLSVWEVNYEIRKIDTRCLPDYTFHVTVDVPENMDMSNLTADKTAAEIWSAVKAHKRVLLSLGGFYICNFVCYMPGRGAVFAYPSVTYNGGDATGVSGFKGILVKPDGSVAVQP